MAVAQKTKRCRATFPEPLYQRYFNDLRNEQLKSTIKVGSGGGIRQLTAGSVSLVGTATDEEAAKVEASVLFVLAGGAVAVVYNIPH